MVYVDPIFDCNGPGGHQEWCHMFADSLAELHEMADRLGMRREWFQNKPRYPHYDLIPISRTEAVRLGAVEVGRKEFVRLSREGLIELPNTFLNHSVRSASPPIANLATAPGS